VRVHSAALRGAAVWAENQRVHIAEGKLFAIFSFDVGFEIDLARARESFPEGVRAGMGGTKIAPAHVQYASPPLVQPLGSRRLLLIERPVDADVSVRLHEFGALSVIFEMPFDRIDGDGLPGLTSELTARGALELDARAVVDDVLPRIARAIARPNLDGGDLVEDYYMVQVTRFEPEMDARTLIELHRDLLARSLHCELARLSASEVDDVLRTAVTYTPQDLVVTDWNVALVYDRVYHDVLNVLELLNVQLLELRHLDRMLDSRVARLYEHLAHHRRLLALAPATLRVRELSELRLDTATLRERMINALKLIGDLYLTKIYTHRRPPAPRRMAAQHRWQARRNPERLQRVHDPRRDRTR
jgi:hypothetical protein